MDEPVTPPLAAPATELTPPPLPVIFRKAADFLRAVPVCRTCAVEHGFPHLYPLPENRKCQIASCENGTAYLAIM